MSRCSRKLAVTGVSFCAQDPVAGGEVQQRRDNDENMLY